MGGRFKSPGGAAPKLREGAETFFEIMTTIFLSRKNPPVKVWTCRCRAAEHRRPTVDADRCGPPATPGETGDSRPNTVLGVQEGAPLHDFTAVNGVFPYPKGSWVYGGAAPSEMRVENLKKPGRMGVF